MLQVYEFDANAVPGSYKNWFEVYAEEDILKPLYFSDDIDKVVKYCYDSGQNFEVNTLQAYYNEHGEE